MNPTIVNVSQVQVRWAIAAHVTPLWIVVSASVFSQHVAVWSPLVAFLGPLLLSFVARDQGPFVNAALRASLAFSLSMATYALLAVAAVGLGYLWKPAEALLYCALLALMIIALNWLIFVGLAAWAAAHRRSFDYPGCLRRWRDLSARLVAAGMDN